MPITDGLRANFHDRRVIGKLDLKERLLDYLEAALLRATQVITSSPGPTPGPGVWFSSVEVVDGGGTHDLTFQAGEGGLYGTDGSGAIVSVENVDDRITDVPFQDTGAVTYYMAARTAEVPEGISFDTDTGVINYDRHRQELGHLAEPTVVVDNTGNITFTLGNHKLHASDTYTGRMAIVYLKAPASPSEAIAVETCTVSGVSITTTGTLGQSVVSTTASDYEVVLVGPTITRLSTIQTDDNWAFIGTVIGGASPRTFDFLGQPAFVPVADLSTQSSLLLKKGWVSLPAVTFGGGGTTVSFGVATAFVNGRIRNVGAAGPVGSFPISSEFFISYNDSTGTYQVFSTEDLADAANKVPILWGRSDGAGAITLTTSAVIGRLMKEFPDPITITVSSDTSHHGSFATLRMALAAAHACQLGSTLTPRGVTIEIVGDVVQTQAISNADVIGVKNVQFVGRGGGQSRSLVAGAGTKGARIAWSYDGSLFDISSGSPTMSGWSFRDITFEYTGTATADTRAVVSNTTGTISGLRFERCTVDGNTVLNGVDAGAGTGALPHLVYSSNGVVSNLTIEHCGIYTRDAAVYQAATAGSLKRLRIYDSEFVQNAASLFSTAGIVQDDSNTTSQHWRIRGNLAEGCRGNVIRARSVDQFWLVENSLQVSTSDSNVVYLGRNSNAAVVDDAWISLNRISRASISNPSAALLLVQAEGVVRMFVTFNAFEDADFSGASAKAILFQANTTAISGPIISGNNIHEVQAGIAADSTDLLRAIVFGNHIEVTDTAYAAQTSEHVVFGNHLESYSGSVGALTVNGEFHAIFGNVVVMDADSAFAIDFGSASNDVALVGNVVSLSVFPLELDGDNHCVVGNIAHQSAGEVRVLSGSTHNTLVGNQFERLLVSGDENVVVGNKLGDDLELAAGVEVVSGNYIGGALQVSGIAQTAIASGNYVAGSTDLSVGNRHMMVGNMHTGAVTVPTNIQSGVILVGDYINDTTALSFAHGGGTIVGCIIRATGFELGAPSFNVAAVGNQLFDASPTDLGTGNVLADNS